MTLEDSVRQSLADHAKGGPTLQGDPDLSEGRDLADLVLSAGATALRYGPEWLRPRPTRPQRWPRRATATLEHAVLAYARLWPPGAPARIGAQLRQPR